MSRENMTRDEKLDELIAMEEIRQAMARYARGADRQDEMLVRSAYHEDAVDAHGYGFAGTGYDTAKAIANDLPKSWKTELHFLGQHLIEVEGDKARSEVAWEGHQTFDDDQGVEWDWMNGGRYLDRWERRNGEFKIANRIVVYDWGRTIPNRTPFPGPDHTVPKAEFGGPEIPAAALEATVWGKIGGDDPSCGFFNMDRGPAKDNS